MKKIKLLIVDDHPFVREGIRAFLSKQPGYVIVGEVDDGSKVMEVVSRLKPDVVIMDITLPKVDGYQATRYIKEKFPKIHVVILSMHHERKYAINAFKSGAEAYVLKGGPPNEIMTAAERAMAGKIYTSPSLSNDLMSDLVNMLQSPKPEPFDTLSQREKEILKLVVEGEKNKQISEKLSIALSTVKVHRKNIQKKLNVTNTISMVKIAIDKGLVQSD